MKESLNFNLGTVEEKRGHVEKTVKGLAEISNIAFVSFDSNLKIKTENTEALKDLKKNFVTSLKLFFDRYDDKLTVKDEEKVECPDCTALYKYNENDLQSFYENAKKIALQLTEANKKYKFDPSEYAEYSDKMELILAEVGFYVANLEKKAA